MALAIPMLIMLVLIASAWALGTLARSWDQRSSMIVGVAGVVAVLLLPVVYDGLTYDGSCRDIQGATSPCSLGERLWNSVEIGFAFTVAPAVLWLATYVFSSRIAK